ncbi:MAG: hypothetical protein Q8M94_08055, partial [Ignavibacteria bacterium]|nr:hypothetical protein [Ignavibacteria bacterium]
MKNKIIVIGGGGYAKVIISAIKKLDEYEIIGYTDPLDKGSVLGIKYLGTDDVLKNIIKKNKNCKAVIGVKNSLISKKRNRLFEMLKTIGFNLPVIVSKSAIINEGVSIGEGTIILEGAIINVGSVIGRGVIVNS